MPEDAAETSPASPAPGAEGVLLGLACGDALGQPVEGWSAERIAAEYGTLDSLVAGTRGLGAGAWTDDTEQAIRLARSIVDRGAFDPDDVADRFLEWFRRGPTGIGGLTRAVLRRVDDGEPWRRASRAEWERRPEGRNAGNGSVMRCAPLAVAFAGSTDHLVAASRESSRLTHCDPRCVYGCELLNRVIAACLDCDSDGDGDGDGDGNGDGDSDGISGPLPTALAALPDDVPGELREPLVGLHERDPVDIRPSGYVVDTLAAALYHGLGAQTLEGAVVEAVNMGGDADTVGAVAGAVAGARFGSGEIPERWLDELHGVDELRRLGRRLEAGAFDVAVGVDG